MKNSSRRRAFKRIPTSVVQHPLKCQTYVCLREKAKVTWHKETSSGDIHKISRNKRHVLVGAQMHLISSETRTSLYVTLFPRTRVIRSNSRITDPHRGEDINLKWINLLSFSITRIRSEKRIVFRFRRSPLQDPCIRKLTQFSKDRV